MKKIIASWTFLFVFSSCFATLDRESPELPLFDGIYYSTDELDVAPVPVEQNIRQDTESSRHKLDGYAIVAFIVSNTGATEQVQVLEATDKKFATEAEKIVDGWLYSPGRIREEPVSTAVSVKLNLQRELSRLEAEWNKGFDFPSKRAPSYSERKDRR